jgi:hypothetical protein
VNGDKGPNQLGRDVFLVAIDERGLQHPGEGFECDVKVDDYRNGLGCTRRVIENGWVMDY